jgi:hypothetical protein
MRELIMADKKIVAKLDKKLTEQGIIKKEFEKDYEKVHTFLNKNNAAYDKYLRNDDFKKCENDLRSWLITLNKQGASQEKLTSYLRSGMAHLCFNYIRLKGEKPPADEHVTRALKSFKKRNFDKTFFKAGK